MKRPPMLDQYKEYFAQIQVPLTVAGTDECQTADKAPAGPMVNHVGSDFTAMSAQQSLHFTEVTPLSVFKDLMKNLHEFHAPDASAAVYHMPFLISLHRCFNSWQPWNGEEIDQASWLDQAPMITLPDLSTDFSIVIGSYPSSVGVLQFNIQAFVYLKVRLTLNKGTQCGEDLTTIHEGIRVLATCMMDHTSISCRCL